MAMVRAAYTLCGARSRRGMERPNICAEARRNLCQAMPAEYEQIRNSRCGAAVEALVDRLWTDVVSFQERTTLQEDLLPGCHFFEGKNCGGDSGLET